MKKHRFYIKAVAALLLLTIMAISFAGCSSTNMKPIKSTEQEIKPIGNVQSVDILYEELRYLTILSKEALEIKYDISIWDNPELSAQYKNELVEMVKSHLTSNAAIVLMANEMFGADQASMDSEIMKEQIQESMESFLKDSFYYGEKHINDENGKRVKYNARKAYEQWLSDFYMTDHLVRYNIYIGLIETQLISQYTDDNLGLIPTDTESVYDAIMDNEKFARVMMIYIEKGYGDEVNANRAKAENIRTKIANGDNFESYLSSSQDFNDPLKNYYYIPEKGSSYGEEVSDVALSLEINELSEIIETANGFYILKRITKDAAKVMSNISTHGDLYDAYVWYEFYKIVDERQGKLEFTFNEYGASLDLTAIK